MTCGGASEFDSHKSTSPISFNKYVSIFTDTYIHKDIHTYIHTYTITHIDTPQLVER